MSRVYPDDAYKRPVVLLGDDDASLAKAEDSAHENGDSGFVFLAVRKDVAAALAGADGDYSPLVVGDAGHLHVIDKNSAAILAALSADLAVTLDGETVVLGAGTAEIGKVDAGRSHTISQTPTITAGAYSAGDAVGGKLTFANAARATGLGGVLTNLRIVDDAGQDAELELWLFDQDFTAMSDNAAWAPSEADLENLVAIISTTGDTWRAAGTPSAIDIDYVKGYLCNATGLYGQFVTRGTPTYAATDDLTAKLTMIRD